MSELLVGAANVCTGLSEGDDELAITAAMAATHLRKLVSLTNVELIARLQTLNSEGPTYG